MDFMLIKGGPCIPQCLPMCNLTNRFQRPNKVPYPHKIAGEYDRGAFTLGHMLNPGTNRIQRHLFQETEPAVGDYLGLLLIPQKHTLKDLFVEVVTTQKVYEQAPVTFTNNMAGFEFDVVARVFDADGAQTGTITLPAAFTGIDGGVDGVVRAAISPATLGEFVPVGSWVEIGLSITALPTANQGKLDRMSGWVGIAAKVEDYQYPVHI